MTWVLLLAMLVWLIWAIATEPRRWRWLWEEVETEQFLADLRMPPARPNSGVWIRISDHGAVEVLDRISVLLRKLTGAQTWRVDLIDNARLLGLTDEQAAALADAYFGRPTS